MSVVVASQVVLTLRKVYVRRETPKGPSGKGEYNDTVRLLRLMDLVPNSRILGINQGSLASLYSLKREDESDQSFCSHEPLEEVWSCQEYPDGGEVRVLSTTVRLTPYGRSQRRVEGS